MLSATIGHEGQKLCKDCKHCRPFKDRVLFWTVTDYELSKCAAVNVNLASGSARTFCDVERDYGDRCGKDGKLWEAA